MRNISKKRENNWGFKNVIRKDGGGYYFGIPRAKWSFVVSSFSEHKMVRRFSEKKDGGISQLLLFSGNI